MAEIEKVKLPNDDTIYDIKDAKAIRGLASGTTSGHVLQFGADGYTVSDSGKSMSDKQDTIDSSHKLSADLIDDTNATNKFTNATEKQTWNGKQNAIDGSHKLSADNVDDTNATNKFATAAELEQIETNKEDIETKATQLMWDIVLTTDPEFLSDGYRVQFQRFIEHETGEEKILDVIVEHANLGNG